MIENEDKVIRLGRSKSLKRNSRDSYQNSRIKLSSRPTSRQRQPLSNSTVNNVMHDEIRMPLSKTHSAFYQQKQLAADINPNPLSTVRSRVSPHHRVVIHSSQNTVDKNELLRIKVLQNEQLQRKVRMLQARIQQVHQEKQSSMLKLHQQNKILTHTNQALKKNLEQTQNIKNTEIKFLKEKVGFADEQNKFNHHLDKSLCEKILNSRKNAVYVDDQAQQPSILLNSVQNKKESTQNAEQQNLDKINMENLQKQNKEQKQKNQKLKQQLQTLKLTYLEEISQVQSNNKKIVQEYEQKIKKLQQNILTNQQKNQDKIKELTEGFSRKINELQKQLQSLNTKYEQQRLQNITRISLQQQKIEQKEKTINEYQQRLLALKLENQQLLNSPKEEKIVESCSKCKELIKTLVKLNQKTMSKTT